MSLLRVVSAFWNDENAAAGVEYALLSSLIAAVIVTTVAEFGQAVLDLFVFAYARIGAFLN